MKGSKRTPRRIKEYNTYRKSENEKDLGKMYSKYEGDNTNFKLDSQEVTETMK
jgi:hypothetical protein